MEFDYTIEGSIWVSEDDLNEMAEKVKNGEPAERVVNDYISCLDDCEYYISYAYEDKIINEIKERASTL